jgi:SAM-dependent methyltransferase
MSIDYVHAENVHTLEGPRAALPFLFPERRPSSLLDVGCGTGTWLKAALESGIAEIMGVDGIDLPADQLLIPRERFRHQDLTKEWDLKRRFDAALCLEVAEHLDPGQDDNLLDALTRHADTIVFSAACPGQPGQHHVNCQWPAHWQQRFNERGYVCDDSVRWRIWDDGRIEAWYRQNIFMARKNAALAGKEPRIKAVLHPGLRMPAAPKPEHCFEEHVLQIERGRMPVGWYLRVPAQAIARKIRRPSA